MLLKKVTIHKYKSFLTEQSLDVEKGITRIVGKNESGKTALLEAIAKTNYFEDNKDFIFNKDLDYPRSELVKVRATNPEVVTCEYELEDEDVAPIEDAFGTGILIGRTISVCSLYDNTNQVGGVYANFDAFKNWVVSEFAVDDSGKAIILNAETFDNLEKGVGENLSLAGMKDVKSRLEIIKKDAHGWPVPLAGYIYFKFIQPAMPKFWYFSDYFSLPPRINLSDFEAGRTGVLSPDEIKIARALFELSGLSVSDIRSENNFEAFRAQLEATSNTITDEMFDYWTTNQNLQIQFEIEHRDNNIRFLNIRIYNSKHRVTLPLKIVAKAFYGFFLFLFGLARFKGTRRASTLYCWMNLV